MKFNGILKLIAFIILSNPALVLAEKIHVAYTALAATQAPVWVAVDRGFFERQGLDVDLAYIRSGPIGLAAILSGEVAFGMVGGAAILSAIEQKAEIGVIAIPIKKPAFSLVTSVNIRTPQDLAGKKIGVTRFGGLYDFAFRYALRQWKIPSNQVQIIQVGGIGEILAAIHTGHIDAAVLADPASFKAIEYGFKEFLNFANLDIAFPMNAVIARQRLLREKPAMVNKFAAGFVAAISFMKAERVKTTAVIKKYTRIDESNLLDKTYDLVVKQYLQLDPSPDVKVLQSAFRMMGKSEDEIRSMNLSRFTDPQFVEGARKAGR
ncbi:MAG: ABC transporter substrate-binding protein [Deltaproteobacteria bacterium]|nr:ABC transporter substrate-binding protein [Deltaproteobacteria bacterium]